MPDEVEEMAVPSYGLEEVGRFDTVFGDYRAELIVDGSTATLHWLKDGKPIKSAPAAVKKDHAEEFKELQASVKDINGMLPAQRERLDVVHGHRLGVGVALLDGELLGTRRHLVGGSGGVRPAAAGGQHRQDKDCADASHTVPSAASSPN